MRSSDSLTVWSWWGHNPSLPEHLVFAAAAHDYGHLQAIVERLQLPNPATVNHLLPFERGFTEAARASGRVLWMPLDQFADGTGSWRSEEQLQAVRTVDSRLTQPLGSCERRRAASAAKVTSGLSAPGG